MGWKAHALLRQHHGRPVPGRQAPVDPARLARPTTGAATARVRRSPAFNVEDTLTWIKGKHSISVGGSFTQLGYNDYFKYYVPFVGIGFDTTYDPAAGMFNTTNFPGASPRT